MYYAPLLWHIPIKRSGQKTGILHFLYSKSQYANYNKSLFPQQMINNLFHLSQNNSADGYIQDMLQEP